jgi:Domain of unknown function (DUF4114)
MAAINGTDGDDLIFSGLGGNTLTGGKGKDLFVLSAVVLPTSPNTITDFAPLDDGIQVDLPSGSKDTDLTTAQTVSDATISFRGTQLAIVQNTLVADLADIVGVSSGNITPTETFTPPAEPAPTVASPIAGISIDKNLFTFDAAAVGFGVGVVSQKAGTKVNEIGVFAIDDVTGKIGGISPGAAGYLKAVADAARPIFTTLDGSFFRTTKREVALDPNKTYQFFQIKDGSIADFQQAVIEGKTPTNILFALPDASGNSPIKVTNNSTNNGYKVSVNNDELVLNIVDLVGDVANAPIGSKFQGLPQGRTIDLTGSTGTLKADLTTTSSASFNNNVGFYAVEDAIGTIKLANGSLLKPGDVNYAVEAIKSAVLQAGKTDSKLNQDIVGGKIYAPVVVAQGSFNDFVSKNPTNGGGANEIHAYFNYLGANSDKTDHFRLLGNNTFGVEDQFGGGDRDFNDLVINLNIKTA